MLGTNSDVSVRNDWRSASSNGKMTGSGFTATFRGKPLAGEVRDQGVGADRRASGALLLEDRRFLEPPCSAS
jgi:hypothetical protein